MSPSMLCSRDELHNFWRAPARRKTLWRKTLWYGGARPIYVATLAIRSCNLLKVELGKAKTLCMRFNQSGCEIAGCLFGHRCLYCGSAEHGERSCEIFEKFRREAQTFKSHFGADPVDPSSQCAGESLEQILLRPATAKVGKAWLTRDHMRRATKERSDLQGWRTE